MLYDWVGTSSFADWAISPCNSVIPQYAWRDRVERILIFQAQTLVLGYVYHKEGLSNFIVCYTLSLLPSFS